MKRRGIWRRGKGEKRGGEKKGWETEEGRRNRKITFWNVAGLMGKDEEFWREVKEWDVVVMLETWLEKKRWKRIKNKLSGEFEWETQLATKRSKKGRAMGGITMGMKKELKMKGKRMRQRGEGMVEWKVMIGKEIWNVGGIYAREGMGKIIEELREWMEEKGREETNKIIGGDFNARTGKRKEARGRKRREGRK